MYARLAVFFLICMIAVACALPTPHSRERRDVMESMKNAWGEMIKTFSDAGDAVVHVFKPTEKTIATKITDTVKGLGQ